MTGDEYIKAYACSIAWWDGEDSGLNGMLGILFVIRNIAAKREGDWLAALMELGTPGPAKDIRDPQFRDLLYLVDGVYDGIRTDSLTDGATGYRFAGELMEGRERTAQIGKLTFYK